MEKVWINRRVHRSLQMLECYFNLVSLIVDKPWLDGGLYRDLWLSHAPVACSGHGTCMNNAGTGYACRCEQDYSGDQCQISKT